MISRRRFLGSAAASGATLATVGATGCSSSGSSDNTASGTSRSTTSTVVRRAGQRPDPSKPEGTDLIPEIEHILVVMMENHSFDNYLGTLGRGDGLKLDKGQPQAVNANAGVNGKTVPMFHMENTCQLKAQPSQQWNDMITQWNNGKMDGFVRSFSGPVSMGYWEKQDLPFYHSLASTFPLCDRWFASCFGQTYPNRRYLLAGTSMGTIHTISQDVTYPPNGTIMDQLNKHNIPWRDYWTSAPTIGLYLKALAENLDKAKKGIDLFYADAAAGTLPAFALIEEDFDKQSEENPSDISVGESFASKVINAVMQSPNWDKTVLIWTYDEHGGYYDHVPPPAAVAPDDVAPILGPGDKPFTFARYGFRVPTVIISPYAKKNYVSHVVHDHTSVLSLIEHKWNLPALTQRDGAADNLLDSLDLKGEPAFLKPPKLAAPANPTDQPICTAPGPVPAG